MTSVNISERLAGSRTPQHPSKTTPVPRELSSQGKKSVNSSNSVTQNPQAQTTSMPGKAKKEHFIPSNKFKPILTMDKSSATYSPLFTHIGGMPNNFETPMNRNVTQNQNVNTLPANYFGRGKSPKENYIVKKNKNYTKNITNSPKIISQYTRTPNGINRKNGKQIEDTLKNDPMLLEKAAPAVKMVNKASFTMDRTLATTQNMTIRKMQIQETNLKTFFTPIRSLDDLKSKEIDEKLSGETQKTSEEKVSDEKVTERTKEITRKIFYNEVKKKHQESELLDEKRIKNKEKQEEKENTKLKETEKHYIKQKSREAQRKETEKAQVKEVENALRESIKEIEIKEEKPKERKLYDARKAMEKFMDESKYQLEDLLEIRKNLVVPTVEPKYKKEHKRLFEITNQAIVNVGKFWTNFKKTSSHSQGYQMHKSDQKYVGSYNRTGFSYNRSTFPGYTHHKEKRLTLQKPKLSTSTDKEDKLRNNFNSLLNKLTESNYDRIFEQFVNIIKKGNEKSVTTFEILIDIIYMKSLKEQRFSKLYSKLIKDFYNKFKGHRVSDKNGEFKQLFLRRILNKKIEKTFKEINEMKKDNMSNDEIKKFKAQALGNIKFVGELYISDFLNTRIMLICLDKILKKENIDEHDYELLCKLLITIGKKLDREKESYKQIINEIYETLKKKAHSLEGCRTKYLIMDIMDLRASRWKSLETKVKDILYDKTPSTPSSTELSISDQLKGLVGSKKPSTRKPAAENISSKLKWDENLSPNKNYERIKKMKSFGRKEFIDFAVVFNAESLKTRRKNYKTLMEFVVDRVNSPSWKHIDLLSLLGAPISSSLISSEDVKYCVEKMIQNIPDLKIDFPNIVKSFGKVYYAFVKEKALDLAFLGGKSGITEDVVGQVLDCFSSEGNGLEGKKVFLELWKTCAFKPELKTKIREKYGKVFDFGVAL